MTIIHGTTARARVIAIIGAGFSGTTLAAELLRQLPPQPTRILLIERSGAVGCGVAYATHDYPYLLNVPVGRMSALLEDSAHLLRFAQRRLPGITADTFLPRRLYGEYLREALGEAQRAAPLNVTLEHLQGETTSIHSLGTEGPLIVSVGTRQLLADQVVIATGDPMPARRAYAADLPAPSAYAIDPYADGCVQPSDRALLLIGTGLTMADVAVAAAEHNPALRIVALSRHGLLPQRQSVAHTPGPALSSAQLAQLSGLPLRPLVRAVRSLVRSAQAQGGDWRDVIGRIREAVPTLWRSLDASDRRRFLRHLRVYWDVHRHRMPPATADRIEQLQRSGRLQIRAGCVTQLCAVGHGIVALWRPRGRYDTQELWVDRVVECSGADHRLERSVEPLWKQLLGDGIARPDAAGIGVRTGTFGALIDTYGRESARLFYLGPMLRADHWEATAVGELRVHARALAGALAGARDAPGHMHMSRSARQLTGLLQGGH